ncbi:caffeic acid 3-O-methyltransferase-like isoform X2 [Corylus avellana]|uniref:caffeic acid 3-O-methyltransferase-like isoform X2 n=1 Tax=Corylus avellana TaxID=13451 RepID=UPI00286B92D7|nr:caffeic acid 3-O-methyltransferase-like isoform X2 [Corylus avellana]
MASTENYKEDDNACLYAMHLSTSHIFPMALTAAIELNLFDIIASRANQDAYMSPSEIASQLPTKNPDAPFLLDRMLRLLATYSLLTCSMRTCEDGRVERLYGVSPAGKFFAQNGDGGLLSSMALLNSHPNVAEVWRHLKDAILEEGNLYEKVHGTTNIFEYMEADPTLNKIFNKAMADLSGISMKKVLETYKGFEGVSLLVDVAGCTGADLNMIISKYPSIRGINFDLPHMIQHAPSYPGIEHVGGDMYVSVPTGDAIMIKMHLSQLMVLSLFLPLIISCLLALEGRKELRRSSRP